MYENPYIAEFIQTAQREEPSKVPSLPFRGNLLAKKNTDIYYAHTYHTKFPPEAIETLIEYYTNEGDIVLDPFCGSGMTGVAALKLNRRVILIDLSPAATFIAYNYLTPIDPNRYRSAVLTISDLCRELEYKLYGTKCRKCGKIVPMEYMVWSYGVICYECHKEFILWDVCRDERPTTKESRIKTTFQCPYCSSVLIKRRLTRTVLYPVLIGYKCCGSRLKETTAKPDEFDLQKIKQIEEEGIPPELWYPKDKLPDGVNTRQVIHHGMDSVDKLYTTRALWAMAALWNIAKRWPDNEVRMKLLFTLTSLYKRVTKLAEFRFWGGSGNTPNLNPPMIVNEQNVFKAFRRKAISRIKSILNYLRKARFIRNDNLFRISTQDATCLRQIPDNSIDYVFTDPPYGANINYSEMNFIWESWLQVFSDPSHEVVINRVRRKTLADYQILMTKALKEVFRVLKPGHWMTMAFHNSSADVWNAILQSITDAGFTIMGAQVLNRQQATFKQLVSSNTVGHTIILHCRKCDSSFNSYRAKIKSEQTRDIEKFIEDRVAKYPERYLRKFRHVKRRPELDYSAIYSEWLCERIKSGKPVSLDFKTFRKVAKSILVEVGVF